MNNLFSALHKYPPSENQITEMLAQVLSHDPALIQLLFNLPMEGSPVVRTQLMVPQKGVAKWIDLAIFETTSSGDIQAAAVVEIKWWSGLNYSPDEEGRQRPQTEFYQKFLEKERGIIDKSRLIYLTRRDEPSPLEWTLLRWTKVHSLLLQRLADQQDTLSNVGDFLTRQFAEFLEAESVPEKEITMSGLLQLPAATQSVGEGFRLLREVYENLRQEHKGNRQEHEGKWTYQARDLNGTICSQLFNHNRLCLVINAKPSPLQVCYAIRMPDKESSEMSLRVWVECDPNRFVTGLHGEIVKSIHTKLPQEDGWILYEKPSGWALLMLEKSLVEFSQGLENAADVRQFFVGNLNKLHQHWPD